MFINFFCLNYIDSDSAICYIYFKQIRLSSGGLIWHSVIGYVCSAKYAGCDRKELGEKLGFKGKTSDVRIAQYESESRTPKPALVKEMAAIFGVSPKAIMVPDIDSEISLMHTFFALEDMYGLTIAKNDGDICLHLTKIILNTLPCSNSSLHGTNRLHGFRPVRSLWTNIMTGVITFRINPPLQVSVPYHPSNSATRWLHHCRQIKIRASKKTYRYLL